MERKEKTELKSILKNIMKNSARENTLNRIRTALVKPTLQPYPHQKNDVQLFKTTEGTLVEQFTTVFKALRGEVFVCSDKYKLILKLKEFVLAKGLKNISYQPASLLNNCQLESLYFINNNEQESEAAITDCEYLVARTGSVVLSSKQKSGRIQSVHTPIHIVIAYEHQLVSDIKDALSQMVEKNLGDFPSAVFFASGPSRTGDIERTLVLGVHGPVEVYVFILENKIEKY